jgi:hypothetical protein
MSQYTNPPPHDPSQGPPQGGSPPYAQPYPPQPGAPPAPGTYVPTAEAPGAIAGLVLGICAIVFNFPILGFVLAWIGFVKSRDARDLCRATPGYYGNAGIAEAGYICSIIGMILGGLSTFCGCGYFILIGMAIAGGW